MKINRFLFGMFFLIMLHNMVVFSQTNNKNVHELDARQKSIVPIAAFTASGDLVKLKKALSDGLNNGLTINEVKEVLIQLYAYAGFPRSLNAIDSFMDIIEQRKNKGVQDELGETPAENSISENSIELGREIQTRLVGRPVKGEIFDFSPAIDQFLKAHLFGDVFGRDGLDFEAREIATIAALANMEGLNPQLKSHFMIAMNIGLSEEQLRSLIAVINDKVGQKQAENAFALLDQLTDKKQRVKTTGGKIIITPTSSMASSKGAKEKFTGGVLINTPFKARAPGRYYGANVVFEPGSRTAWHSHTLGQMLIVTSGEGLIQSWGGEIMKISKGDVVWIPPNLKHWHGASPDSSMSHIAIVEEIDNIPSTQWLEKVSHEQYNSGLE